MSRAVPSASSLSLGGVRGFRSSLSKLFFSSRFRLKKRTQAKKRINFFRQLTFLAEYYLEKEGVEVTVLIKKGRTSFILLAS